MPFVASPSHGFDQTLTTDTRAIWRAATAAGLIPGAAPTLPPGAPSGVTPVKSTPTKVTQSVYQILGVLCGLFWRKREILVCGPMPCFLWAATAPTGSTALQPLPLVEEPGAIDGPGPC